MLALSSARCSHRCVGYLEIEQCFYVLCLHLTRKPQCMSETRHHGSQCNVSKAVRHPMPSPRKRMTALSAFEMYVFFDLSRSRTENSQLQIWRRNSRFQQMFSGRNMSASTPATVVWSSRPSNQWRVHILAPYFDAKKR